MNHYSPTRRNSWPVIIFDLFAAVSFVAGMGAICLAMGA